jgi:hypothetical protein
LSQRKIAARLGVSRGTVGAISNGRRGVHGKESQASDSGPLAPQGPPERCASCGFTVYMPCLICRSRDYRVRQAQLRANNEAETARAPMRRNSRKSTRTAIGTRRTASPVAGTRPAHPRPAVSGLRSHRARVA